MTARRRALGLAEVTSGLAPTVEHDQDEGFVHLTVRVPRSLRTRLNVTAAGEDRSVQAIVTDALTAYLENHS